LHPALHWPASSPLQADDTIINNAFHPYRDALPQAPGLNPGMLIERSNVERFKELLDPAMLTSGN
jgi:hypothetical protein